MNPNDALNLKKLINDTEVEQTTEQIRTLKHSKKIKVSIDVICALKKRYSRLNKEQFKNIAMNQASFLYNNYTNIFNRLVSEELELDILYEFVKVLEKIENGDIDQHQGSYDIGLLLKKLYIDSTIKQDKKREKGDKRKDMKNKPKSTKNISWAQYKELYLDKE
uniref:Uncharacterized protein n=1 Tax=viral metagenome TaxID=1070528 RepID=A0A6C0KDS9_9ZZZZ